MHPTLVIIDATALIFRAFYAPRQHQLPSEERLGAARQLITTLCRYLTQGRSRHFALVFDHSRDTYRRQLDPRYKAQREEAPELLAAQLPIAMECASAAGFRCFQLPGYEADDLMATLATRARAESMASWLVSPDKDIYQLVDDGPPSIRVFDPRTKRVIGAAQVEEIIGVPARVAVDYFALVGDSSDGISGVKGIGPKTAAALIARFGSLAALYDALDRVPELEIRGARGVHDKLVAGRGDAALSRILLRLEHDALLSIESPLAEALSWKGPRDDVGEVLARYDMAPLADRLRRVAADHQSAE